MEKFGVCREGPYPSYMQITESVAPNKRTSTGFRPDRVREGQRVTARNQDALVTRFHEVWGSEGLSGLRACWLEFPDGTRDLIPEACVTVNPHDRVIEIAAFHLYRASLIGTRTRPASFDWEYEWDREPLSIKAEYREQARCLLVDLGMAQPVRIREDV